MFILDTISGMCTDPGLANILAIIKKFMNKVAHFVFLVRTFSTSDLSFLAVILAVHVP